MIELIAIHKKFGKLPVLQQVSLLCKQAECIALTGPNGCGKTTLIKIILGMVFPDSGVIKIDDKDILKQHDYRKNIGYMPQIGRYPDHMSIGRVIETIQHLRSPDSRFDNDLFDAYRIKDISHKKMNTLSGGTRQKLSAVLCFLFQPSIIILDEPTAGLDPLAAEILKEKILAEKNKGKLILITSHLLAELEDVVSELVFMQEGKIIFHNKTSQIKEATGQLTLAKSLTKLLKQNSYETYHNNSR